MWGGQICRFSFSCIKKLSEANTSLTVFTRDMKQRVPREWSVSCFEIISLLFVHTEDPC